MAGKPENGAEGDAENKAMLPQKRGKPFYRRWIYRKRRGEYTLQYTFKSALRYPFVAKQSRFYMGTEQQGKQAYSMGKRPHIG